MSSFSSSTLYIIIVIMTVLGALAAVSLKLAVGLGKPTKIILSYKFWLGGCLYLLAAILNIFVLKHMLYSVVLPMTSLTYIWTLIAGFLIFKEKIRKPQVIGVLFISLGAFFIAL